MKRRKTPIRHVLLLPKGAFVVEMRDRSGNFFLAEAGDTSGHDRRMFGEWMEGVVKEIMAQKEPERGG